MTEDYRSRYLAVQSPTIPVIVYQNDKPQSHSKTFREVLRDFECGKLAEIYETKTHIVARSTLASQHAQNPAPMVDPLPS